MSWIGLPEQASSIAPRVDALMYAVIGVTGFVALGIFVVMAYMGIRYRAASNAPRAADVRALQSRVRRRAELVWTLTPLFLFLCAFGWAARLYLVRAQTPADAVQLFVVARQWMWKLQHPGGQREVDELHVARGQTVELVMTSEDVIHSFFVPAFRLKQDVLPGMYTHMWFTPTAVGRFHLFCAEYCGTNHARMGGDIVVMEAADFERWLAAHPGGNDMASRGATLFHEFGCSGCHGENAVVHAPNLAGLYGRPVPLADGTTVVADERYIRDSILLPRKEVAAGYEPIMPSFAGKIGEEDILDLIAYLKILAHTTERPR